MGRNLTDAVDGFLLSTRYLIMDRDPLFTHAFRTMLAVSGVKSVRLHECDRRLAHDEVARGGRIAAYLTRAGVSDARLATLRAQLTAH
jgi:hypothetical protein